jgi:hypothetical protein
MREYIPAPLRRLVMRRAVDTCEYCRARAEFSSDPLTVDHIIAVSRNGRTVAENLACACFGCNQRKANLLAALDPMTELPAPLFHPREQAWNEHFYWSEDFTHILALTPTGRATIEALQLNRAGLVNLRRALHAIGEHPPA